jgi:hypothetical protein
MRTTAILLIGVILCLLSSQFIIAPGVEPYIICHANNRFCEGTQIWECNEYGTVTNFVEDCGKQSCAQSGNEAYCTEKLSSSGITIGLIMAIFIGIIAIILYIKYKIKKRTRRKKN